MKVILTEQGHQGSHSDHHIRGVILFIIQTGWYGEVRGLASPTAARAAG